MFAERWRGFDFDFSLDKRYSPSTFGLNEWKKVIENSYSSMNGKFESIKNSTRMEIARLFQMANKDSNKSHFAGPSMPLASHLKSARLPYPTRVSFFFLHFHWNDRSGSDSVSCGLYSCIIYTLDCRRSTSFCCGVRQASCTLPLSHPLSHSTQCRRRKTLKIKCPNWKI